MRQRTGFSGPVIAFQEKRLPETAIPGGCSTLPRAGPAEIYPAGCLPVSAAILEQFDEYRITLESYSARLLPLIKWEPTEEFNVRVLNDTGDFYRFFDATPQAEFLYSCVQKTIEHDLPAETDFLRRYDQFRRQVESFIEMPERLVDLLFRFLNQNGGRLSQRAREREFKELTDEETKRIEAIYNNTFTSG